MEYFTLIKNSKDRSPFMKWTEYKFIPMKIDKNSFDLLKNILNSNSAYQISSRKGIKDLINEFYKGILVMILAGILLGFIGVIIDWFNDKLKDLFESFIGGLILVFFWRIIFGGPRSFLSYLFYMKKHNLYFADLKILIINSNDYDTFLLEISQ